MKRILLSSFIVLSAMMQSCSPSIDKSVPVLEKELQTKLSKPESYIFESFTITDTVSGSNADLAANDFIGKYTEKLDSLRIESDNIIKKQSSLKNLLEVKDNEYIEQNESDWKATEISLSDNYYYAKTYLNEGVKLNKTLSLSDNISKLISDFYSKAKSDTIPVFYIGELKYKYTGMLGDEISTADKVILDLNYDAIENLTYEVLSDTTVSIKPSYSLMK